MRINRVILSGANTVSVVSKDRKENCSRLSFDTIFSLLSKITPRLRARLRRTQQDDSTVCSVYFVSILVTKYNKKLTRQQFVLVMD